MAVLPGWIILASETCAMPLQTLAVKGEIPRLNSPIEFGLDVNALGAFGDTPLDLAVRGKPLESVKIQCQNKSLI